jgi:hypothetical protein
MTQLFLLSNGLAARGHAELNPAGRNSALSGHSQRREHLRASLGAARAGVGADATMLVLVGMARTFSRAGTAEGYAGRELRLERLPISRLIGARHHARGGRANRRAIQIETDACDQALDMLFGQAGIGAGGAGFDAKGTGVDTCANGVGMGRMFRM